MGWCWWSLPDRNASVERHPRLCPGWGWGGWGVADEAPTRRIWHLPVTSPPSPLMGLMSWRRSMWRASAVSLQQPTMTNPPYPTPHPGTPPTQPRLFGEPSVPAWRVKWVNTLTSAAEGLAILQSVEEFVKGHVPVWRGLKQECVGMWHQCAKRVFFLSFLIKPWAEMSRMLFFA